ncbi:carboxypeptidase N subunit 2 [Tetranychus urticae]|uniref:carboxypeptidase N subunit 2 n=1 Tax=Tetranychus urticae TaxID=32264 RepID=UPI00077BD979|nr:carboxypeptidase N subunit 2 [Tetranychus urticae]
MHCHLHLLFMVIIFTSNPVLSEDKFIGDDISNQADQTFSFFKKWSCTSENEAPDCSSKDIDKIDIPLVFNSGNAIKFAHNKIEELYNPFYDNHNIIEIDFSTNKLNSITENVFANLSAVEKVDLSHNSLWTFDSETFSSMTNLQSLDLSFNGFSIIGPEIFSKLQKVKKLSLRNNNFHIIQDDTFEHLLALEELDLGDNQLSELPDQLFRYNLNLRLLCLSGNDFKKVPTEALAGIPRLYRLDLSRNKFVRLRYPAFKKLSSVNVLRLDDQPDLRSIGPQSFQGMDNLAYFYASNNDNLRFVDPKAFYDNTTDKPVQLQTFIFRHNSVTTMSGKLLDWDKLYEIDLTGNPWNCDCHLDWIIQVQIRDHLKPNLVCKHPTYLKDFQIFNMTSDQFKCSFLFNHEFTIIGTVLLIITISMIMVVFLYVIVKLLPCPKLRNPWRRSYGYSKVKVSRNGKNYDLEWDPALGDPK